MILSTDMAKHFKFVGEFHSCVDQYRVPISEAPGYVIDLVQSRPEDHQMILSGIVHAADLSASTRPWDRCKEWATRILREFFVQGDREREQGRTIGALNDRNATSISKSQVCRL